MHELHDITKKALEKFPIGSYVRIKKIWKYSSNTGKIAIIVGYEDGGEYEPVNTGDTFEPIAVVRILGSNLFHTYSTGWLKQLTPKSVLEELRKDLRSEFMGTNVPKGK